ncbi:MAG: twin-arginine translocase subunit TatC [Verrucomicrobia bacterium]|nr:twin-arginine translocase subunit TatC [Verrucomicrobiota bacterium]
MGFFQHLEELRWTLIKCAVVYVIFAVLIGVFLKEFNDTLLWPLNQVKASFPKLTLDLGTNSIMEAFSVMIQLCCLGALLPASPFVFFFVGQFVAPALTRKEKRLIVPACLVALMLFSIGSAFSFGFLVPSTIRVSAELNEMFGFAARWTAGSYYSLLGWLVIGVGLSFEFPLVIVLLIHLGVMKVETLRKYRKHAIVVIFIIAAVVTPTPDPFTQTMFAIPLYVLFELAIVVGARVQKRREAAAV